VPRAVVAQIERGNLDGVRIGQLRAVVVALRADLDIILRWNGTDLDRLLNAGHSAMHELVVGILTAAGWEVVPERSFLIWGERGVIDIVAWLAPSRTLLIVELKTEIVDVQRLIGTVDRYRRLAPQVVRDLGWEPVTVGAWVAVAESPTNRRRLGEPATVRPPPGTVLPIRCVRGEPYGGSVVAATRADGIPSGHGARQGGRTRSDDAPEEHVTGFAASAGARDGVGSRPTRHTVRLAFI